MTNPTSFVQPVLTRYDLGISKSNRNINVNKSKLKYFDGASNFNENVLKYTSEREKVLHVSLVEAFKSDI